MTWEEMKEFCNSLDEKQLKQKVILWREDEATTKIETEILSEDYYVDPECIENGCFPLCDVNQDDFEELEKVYDKGTPILWEKF